MPNRCERSFTEPNTLLESKRALGTRAMPMRFGVTLFGLRSVSRSGMPYRHRNQTGLTRINNGAFAGAPADPRRRPESNWCKAPQCNRSGYVASMSTWKAKGPAAEYLAARADALPLLVRCSRCRWKKRARSDEARAAFQEHLQSKHPELIKPKRRSSKRVWRKEAA
jgi:hypothetical protein